MPAILAVLGGFTSQLWGYHWILAIVIWAVSLTIYGIVSWGAYPRDQEASGLLLDKFNDEEEILNKDAQLKQLRKIVEDLSFKSLYSQTMRAMAAEYIKYIVDNGIKPDYFSEMIDEILSPAYTQGDFLFGAQLSEKWNYCLYLLNTNTGMLAPVWRRKSPTHPSSDMGRSWRPGEGHVGKAFIDRKVIYTSDATASGVAQLCGARDSKAKKYDDKTYVSFASIPLTVSIDDEIDPIGVFVATSDHEGRFSDPASVDTLMHFAGTIAAILAASQADYSCLFNVDPDIS